MNFNIIDSIFADIVNANENLKQQFSTTVKKVY